MNIPKVKGFTLIEIMITIVIVSILSTLATVGYRSYIVKARRQDVQEQMIILQQQVEESYALNHTYSNAIPDTLDFEGKYQITYKTTGGYQIIATAIGSQKSDKDCLVLILNRNGVKQGGTSTGNVTDNACW